MDLAVEVARPLPDWNHVHKELKRRGFVLGPQKWGYDLFLAVATLNYGYKMLAAAALIPLLYLVRKGIHLYLGNSQAEQLRLLVHH